jgi:hypothetical protein
VPARSPQRVVLTSNPDYVMSALASFASILACPRGVHLSFKSDRSRLRGAVRFVANLTRIGDEIFSPKWCYNSRCS